MVGSRSIGRVHIAAARRDQIRTGRQAVKSIDSAIIRHALRSKIPDPSVVRASVFIAHAYGSDSDPYERFARWAGDFARNHAPARHRDRNRLPNEAVAGFALFFWIEEKPGRGGRNRVRNRVQYFGLKISVFIEDDCQPARAAPSAAHAGDTDRRVPYRLSVVSHDASRNGACSSLGKSAGSTQHNQQKGNQYL